MKKLLALGLLNLALAAAALGATFRGTIAATISGSWFFDENATAASLAAGKALTGWYELTVPDGGIGPDKPAVFKGAIYLPDPLVKGGGWVNFNSADRNVEPFWLNNGHVLQFTWSFWQSPLWGSFDGYSSYWNIATEDNGFIETWGTFTLSEPKKITP